MLYHSTSTVVFSTLYTAVPTVRLMQITRKKFKIQVVLAKSRSGSQATSSRIFLWVSALVFTVAVASLGTSNLLKLTDLPITVKYSCRSEL